MELYSKKSSSIIQKAIITIGQILLIFWSLIVIYQNGLFESHHEITIKDIALIILVSFNIINFLRFIITLFVFIKRKIPFEEAFSVILAFALYYVGFIYLGSGSNSQNTILIYIGIILFFVGCFFNTGSETQRHLWKKNVQNAGQLYTKGLFGISRHPNYFGDLLWVLGYAAVTANVFSLLIPVALFMFFYFYNIPLQEKHLQEKYKEQFEQYKAKTKKFIPYIL